MAVSSSECYPCQTGFVSTPNFLESALDLIRPALLKFDYPLPYGAIVHEGGVQFVVFSRSATTMRVLFYEDVNSPDPNEVVDFDPDLNRWGDVWSLFVPGVKPGQLYHFQADGPYEPEKGQRFDSKARLIDPYARALGGNFLPAEGGVVLAHPATSPPSTSKGMIRFIKRLRPRGLLTLSS